MRASYVFYNGSVLTVDASDSETEAVAVKGGTIMATGRDEDILNLAGPDTDCYNLKGATVTPGIIDAHSHFLTSGLRKQATDISVESGVKDVPTLLSRMAREVSRSAPGEWVRGTNYYQYQLKENRHPSLIELDAIAPDNPVVLYHCSGHAYVANSRAMAKAGVTAATPSPPGGTIEKANGSLTGLLAETAMDYIRRVNHYSPEEISEGIQSASSHYLQNGVTSTCDMGPLDGQERDLTRQLLLETARDRNKVRVRMTVVGGANDDCFGNSFMKTGMATGFGDHKASIGPYKLFLDGTSELGTAALEQPYAGDPGNLGTLCLTEEELESRVREARRKGWQVSVHVIGDRAARLALEAFEKCEASDPSLFPKPQTRFPYRLEHVWYIDPAYIQRLFHLKVQPILNPVFLWEASDNVAEYVGGDLIRQRAALIKSFFDKGLPPAAGSDYPICPVNPLLGIEHAITRMTQDGKPRNPGESVSFNQALRMYTYNGAIAVGEENIKGSIEAGKLADLTIFSGDLKRLPPGELSGVTVKATMVNGDLLYKGPDF